MPPAAASRQDAMQITFRTPSRALERYATWIGSPELRRTPARVADDRLGHPNAVGRYVCAGVGGR
jgi:hypothetical protein